MLLVDVKDCNLLQFGGTSPPTPPLLGREQSVEQNCNTLNLFPNIGCRELYSLPGVSVAEPLTIPSDYY